MTPKASCETEVVTLRRLQKWHGAGNDFLVDVVEPGEGDWWTLQRARAICHRTTGVGADGVLVATLSAPVAMVLFNADGSNAEMSGNGIRCLAGAVRRATQGTFNTLEVTTPAGVKHVTLEMSDERGWGSVAMGDVTFLDPVEGSLGVVNVGNPHVVVADEVTWNDAQREELAAKLAAQVGGANVEFLSVLSKDRLRIRVIERGVGWTEACGTGSVAVAALARRDGLTGDEVTVENPGGELVVTLGASDATLSGPVQFVADVEWLEV
jgi:diaminopimelate epimerase